jgi:hypothetical protein
MVTLVARGTIVTIVTTVARVARVAKVAQFTIVARFARVARVARVAIEAIVTRVAIPTTDICFIVFFKVGVFGGEVFAHAIYRFVFSVQKVLVGLENFCFHNFFVFYWFINNS